MFKNIMVPLDGSPLAEAILPQVVELARLHGAELVLLRVALAHGFPMADPMEAQGVAVREAEEYLQKIGEGVRERGVRTSTVVRYGNPAEEILGHAEATSVDLIAMGTHGRTGVGRWVFGSVAEKVLRASRQPLLLLRAARGPAGAAATDPAGAPFRLP